MTATVSDLLRLLDALAPLASAESYDNVGLLLGDLAQRVETCYVSLDVTPDVIRRAQDGGAQLLLTHHPLMFSPVSQIVADDYEGSLLLGLARSGLSLAAMHTNWDIAPGGVNDALVSSLGLESESMEGLYRAVHLPQAQSLSSLWQKTRDALGFPVRAYGDADRAIRRLWIAAGAGGEEMLGALGQGVDCVLTGELKHHILLTYLESGISVIEAGHAATEWPGVEALGKSLQKAVDTVQYNVRVLIDMQRFGWQTLG